jgi:hypothetical protein
MIRPNDREDRMGRIVGILLFVVALWFMASQYTGGFGVRDESEARTQPTTERVRESVERAQADSEERLERLLPD